MARSFHSLYSVWLVRYAHYYGKKVPTINHEATEESEPYAMRYLPIADRFAVLQRLSGNPNSYSV